MDTLVPDGNDEPHCDFILTSARVTRRTLTLLRFVPRLFIFYHHLSRISTVLLNRPRTLTTLLLTLFL